MISIKLTLDTRRIKQDKTYPVVFRISFNGDSRDIKSGYSVKECDWNIRTGKPKETSKPLQIMLQRLQELHATYLQKIVELEKNPNTFISVQDIKDELTDKKVIAGNVCEFWTSEIAHLKKSNRIGGSHIYQEALTSISKVVNLEIPFEKLDYDLLKKIEAEYLSRGLKINTLSLHLRTLRAIYNKAINSKLVGYEHYPFRYYRIKKERIRPRTITMLEMKRYFNLNLNKTSYLYDTWLLGKLMFMLIGINFNDLITLTEESIRADRVLYRRAKTKRLYSIKLLPEAIEIIEHFRKEGNVTLLGRVSRDELNNKARFTLVVRHKNKLFNTHLTKIGKLIGCEEKLTGYVFRYTWANIAKQLGYSKDLIAEALGHEYGNKVTGIYLDAYDLKRVDEMNSDAYFKITSK